MIDNIKHALLLFILSFSVHGQVGIGTNTPDASAVLDIQSSSNNKGILIPRMTQGQRNAIGSPATGLMIFQTDGNAGFYYYDGSSWEGFGEVKTVNGNSPASNGNITLTFLATQTGTQAQRAATASPTDGLVHIVTGDAPAENDKVYIYSTGISTWTLSSGFTDTDEQDISGSSFTDATSLLVIDIEDGSGQTLDLSALEELVNNADPATNLGGASQGDLAYDTTDDELQVFDGTSWVAVSSSVVTPTLHQVTDVGSTTTNGINIGSLTVNSQFTLPTAKGTAGQYLTVSTTTSELVFASPAAVVTPTLDQVTDVGSTTTNSIEVGGATLTGNLTVSVTTALNGNTTVGNSTTDDLTITARLNSDLIPKTDNSRNLGSSSLNFDTVNTQNVTSNAAMTVSSTGILTLNTSATGTPTISLQQGGSEIAGVGSETFFMGDSSAGDHYFFPKQYNISPVAGYDNTEIGILATVPTTYPNRLVFANINELVSKTLSDVTRLDSSTPHGILVTGGSFVVSGTSSSFYYDNFDVQGSSTNSITITLGRGSGDDRLRLYGLLDTSIGLTTSTLNIGTPSTTLQTTYSQYFNSGDNNLNLNSGSENGEVTFSVDGSPIAGINSSTFMVTNGTSFYSLPEISTLPAIPANQVLAYTATNTINFLSNAALPSGTTNGQTLRYNAGDSSWDATDLLKINTSEVNVSTVVSATGFNTTGTATITTLTVGDTSKYTLPTTRGTAGQVLTVSTTTSQLVFAGGQPNYMIVSINDEPAGNGDTDINLDFGSPDKSNGISKTGDDQGLVLPIGKIYKAVAYIYVNAFDADELDIDFQFFNGSSYIGYPGQFIFNDTANGDNTLKYSYHIPATAIIDCTSSAKTINLRLVSVSTDNIGNVTIKKDNSYLIINEL